MKRFVLSILWNSLQTMYVEEMFFRMSYDLKCLHIISDLRLVLRSWISKQTIKLT